MRRRPDRSRFYGVLLRLFPSDFRQEFGPDMEQLFRDRLAERESRLGRNMIRVHAAIDLAAHAAWEWTKRVRDSGRIELREGNGMDGWIQDARFGARTLKRRPGFTIAAVVTLALGIGANVSIFSVVNGVLLNPLPYPDSEDLVVVWTENTVTGDRGRGVDHPDVRLVREEVPDLELAGFSGTRPTLTGFGDPQVVFGARVTDGLIELMGHEPWLGRDLRAEDDTPGGPPVIVVSHGFWNEQLGADPDVLGRTITLNDAAWEVVGVAPPRFDFPNGSDLWMPRRHEVDGCGHGCRIMNAVGRIGPAARIETVQERLDVVAAGMAEAFPNSHRDERFALQPMLDYEVADVRRSLWVLLAAVGMVLLIACANVANLMLVRASTRRGEVRLRATLGASRFRIVRQLLTESTLLALLAGTLGVLLAHWGTELLVSGAPESLPRLDEVAVDPAALTFAGLLVVFVTGVFGIVPALHATRPGGNTTSASARSTGQRGSDRSRSLLLVAEVALSLTLLLGSGLLIRTLGKIGSVELGFETEGVERFRVSLPEARYDSVQVGRFVVGLEEELARIPGVAAAGWGFGVPLSSGSISTSVSLLDRPELPPPDRPSMDIRPATPGFLEATGTPLRLGRWLDETDRYGAPMVGVINDAAVRAFYPDRDPIGQRIRADVSWAFADTPALTIVGVVGDVVKSSPTEAPAPALYLSNAQFGANTGYVSLKLEPGFESVIPDARRVVARLDPSLAIWNVTTMEDVVSEARAPTVFFTLLLSAFSVVALVLAAGGLYGVVAYAVAQRTREIGVRIALGAASSEVVRMVVRQGLRPAVAGITLGLAASLLAGKQMASLLFEVSPQDPITLATASVVILVVSATATALPARRASRVAPAEALRSD